MPLIRLRDVRRTYSAAGRPDVDALRGIDLDVSSGEYIAVVGPSGGGKTTLMNILGLLDEATSGTYHLDGDAVDARDARRAAGLRARTIGFVFQAFHLLDARPAVDSVELNLLYRGMPRRERKRKVLRAIAAVDLSERAYQSTSTLSGGQRQRIAIARAIAADAQLILADEPTGNLDSVTAGRVLAELDRLNRAGATVIVVTHSAEVASRARRVIRIADGQLVSDESQTTSGGDGPGKQQRAQEADGAPSRSRVRLVDMFRDAWASVRSRRSASIGQALAVAIAVGLTITTLGLSTSARAQVSATFDAHLNREVSATWSTRAEKSPPLEEVPETVEQLSGVDAAAVVVSLNVSTVSTFAEARQIRPHVAIGDIAGAARLTVREARWHEGALAAGEVFIGDLLAKDMQLSDIDRAPVIRIDGVPYTVAGVITASSRLPLLRGEVVLGPVETLLARGPTDVTMLAVTSAGAAQQVAGQLPAALNPFDPQSVAVVAPTDSTQLRGQIEQGVQATLTAFTLLALVVAIAALMNATLLAVNARRGEIGMRKALGARDRDIGGLITIESAYIGIVGGIAGLVIGMGAILVVTVTQRWAPVFDLALLPVAIGVGLLVGAVGGGLAAIRAARLRPADNLRA